MNTKKMLELAAEAAGIDYRAALAQQVQQDEPVQEPVAVHQFRKQCCAAWYDGHPDHTDWGGPYEERTLYTAAADDLGRILAQRDSLLEVLKEVEPFLVVLHGPSWSLAARKRVRHAIKMVEGDQQ